MPEAMETELKEAAEISMGSEVSEEDMEIVKDLCEQVRLDFLKKRTIS